METIPAEKYTYITSCDNCGEDRPTCYCPNSDSSWCKQCDDDRIRKEEIVRLKRQLQELKVIND